jgi:hypothetical protein
MAFDGRGSDIGHGVGLALAGRCTVSLFFLTVWELGRLQSSS